VRHPPPRLVPPIGETGSSDDPGDADGDDEAADERLEDALRSGRAWAEREVLRRFTGPVRRVLVRIVGSSAEIDDLTQEVFLRGLDRIARLRPGTGLRRWFTGFAVNVAREMLRARARRRWLVFIEPRKLPAAADDRVVAGPLDAEADAVRALRATYEVLAELPADPRTLFALRHLEGMELAEMAATCGVSLATIKRRVARAEQAFQARAARHPWLRAWVKRTGE
jgi:RNA polymerase sigma-70 factor (ECF subfamily)